MDRPLGRTSIERAADDKLAGIMGQIPAFYRDNSITALGPTSNPASSTTAVSAVCASTAVRRQLHLYDDDGASNGYRSNQFRHHFHQRATLSNTVAVNIALPWAHTLGSHAARLAGGTVLHQCRLQCRGRRRSVSSVTSAELLAAAGSGYYVDGADHLLRMALPSASITQPHLVTSYLNLTSPLLMRLGLTAAVVPISIVAGDVGGRSRLSRGLVWHQWR